MGTPISKVTVTLPIRTVVESTTGGQIWERARRAKSQRMNAALGVSNPLLRAGFVMRQRPAKPDAYRQPVELLCDVEVTFTRIAFGRGLDPHDNLPASMKHVLDGVADALGIDDRDPRVTWRFAQTNGPRKQYWVRIDITRRGESRGEETCDGIVPIVERPAAGASVVLDGGRGGDWPPLEPRLGDRDLGDGDVRHERRATRLHAR
jgi:hypothetical protein